MEVQTTHRQATKPQYITEIHSIAQQKERKARLLYSINAGFILLEYAVIAIFFHSLFQWKIDGAITPEYLALLGTILVIFTFLSLNHKLYKLPSPYGWVEEVFRLMRVSFTTFMITAGLLFLLKVSVIYSRAIIIVFFFGMFFLAWGNRLLKRLLFRWLAARKVLVKNVLIIGAGKVGKQLSDWIASSPSLGYNVVGFLDDFQNGQEIKGKLSDFRRVIYQYDVDEVFISIPSQRNFVQDLTRQLKNARVNIKIVPELYDLLTSKVALEQVQSIPFLEIARGQQDFWGWIVKRSIDIIFSLTGMVILAPVYLLLSILIKIDSPGPVIFKQDRVGKDGKMFKIYKFRTMVVNAEQKLKEDPVLYKKYMESNYKLEPKDDPRVTKLGRFLRETSLDELPQLWNVLKGEMSLVGPRPVVVEELKEYGEKAADFLSVKPGLTGYWQVSGRSRIGYPDRVDIELYYVYHQSLALDLKILLSTIVSVLKREGAY